MGVDSSLNRDWRGGGEKGPFLAAVAEFGAKGPGGSLRKVLKVLVQGPGGPGSLAFLEEVWRKGAGAKSSSFEKGRDIGRF